MGPRSEQPATMSATAISASHADTGERADVKGDWLVDEKIRVISCSVSKRPWLGPRTDTVRLQGCASTTGVAAAVTFETDAPLELKIRPRLSAMSRRCSGLRRMSFTPAIRARSMSRVPAKPLISAIGISGRSARSRRTREIDLACDSFRFDVGRFHDGRPLFRFDLEEARKRIGRTASGFHAHCCEVIARFR